MYKRSKLTGTDLRQIALLGVLAAAALLLGQPG
jgi:hypothetical protein